MSTLGFQVQLRFAVTLTFGKAAGAYRMGHSGQTSVKADSVTCR